MSSSSEKLYLSRKLGIGMGIRYVISSITPLFIVLLITAVLTFSLVFISSISNAIDRMIVLLGSSSLSSPDSIPMDILPPGSSIDRVKRGQGILYSEDNESLVYIKGVEKNFFNSERITGLKISFDDFSDNWIILSSNLSSSLGVGINDRMTLLLYEEENERTRPILMTVAGIFDSGYSQLDRYMAFADFSLLAEGESTYEILLPEDVDVDRVQSDLEKSGYSLLSYKQEYSYLYANVQQSIWILYVILVAVALLSAYFSVDVAIVYMSRDRQDIASLMLLGMNRKRVLFIYLKLILAFVFISSVLGVIIGIVLGYLSPSIVRMISSLEPDLLKYYVSSFTIKIPYFQILLMIVAMLALAFVALLLILKRYMKEDLLLLVNNE